MKKIGIIGKGMTKFGEHWEKGLRELAVEAGSKAIEDAGIDGKEIDAIYGANMSAGRFVGQEHIGALMADQSGLIPKPAVRLEAACASGGVALREAYLSITSGVYDCVIVGGVEKMTDLYTEQTTTTLGGASDQEWEAFFGSTFPALYALMAKRHMHEYGTTEEQLAHISVKNHHNASFNEYAQFQFEVTVDKVMSSSKVADPLKLLDCSPITDGAAAVIIASEEFIKKKMDRDHNVVWIKASAQTSDTLALHDRKSLTRLDATVLAAKNAYRQAGLTGKDIQLVEVHDCFTIAELMAIEDLGFAKKGEASELIEQGYFDLNSDISVNASGGLKGCGHPVGATGVKQAVEIAKQLCFEAGKNQVKDAEIGMTHNIGGSGATCVVHIFER